MFDAFGKHRTKLPCELSCVASVFHPLRTIGLFRPAPDIGYANIGRSKRAPLTWPGQAPLFRTKDIRSAAVPSSFSPSGWPDQRLVDGHEICATATRSGSGRMRVACGLAATVAALIGSGADAAQVDDSYQESVWVYCQAKLAQGETFEVPWALAIFEASLPSLRAERQPALNAIAADFGKAMGAIESPSGASKRWAFCSKSVSREAAFEAASASTDRNPQVSIRPWSPGSRAASSPEVGRGKLARLATPASPASHAPTVAAALPLEKPKAAAPAPARYLPPLAVPAPPRRKLPPCASESCVRPL